MSQLVRLEGKHSTQNAHCALVSRSTCLARILDIAFNNVFVFTIRQYLFVTLNTDLVR